MIFSLCMCSKKMSDISLEASVRAGPVAVKDAKKPLKQNLFSRSNDERLSFILFYFSIGVKPEAVNIWMGDKKAVTSSMYSLPAYSFSTPQLKVLCDIISVCKKNP